MLRAQRRTILRRIKQRTVARFRWFSVKLAAALAGITTKRGRERAFARAKKRADLNRAQWRRWYQADQKHKRQLRALRRMGVRLRPNAWNLPRYIVP